MTGRPMKSIQAKTKHLSKAERQIFEASEDLVVQNHDQLEKIPDELRDVIAQKEWKRVIDVLDSIKLIGNADRTNLIGYCNVFSRWIEAQQNDNDDLIIKYGRELREYEKLCYLTPDARLKAGMAKVKKEAEKIEEKFGVI